MNLLYYSKMWNNAIDAGRSGDWDTVKKIASYDANMAASIFCVIEKIMPDAVKCSIALKHYTHHGDGYKRMK